MGYPEEFVEMDDVESFPEDRLLEQNEFLADCEDKIHDISAKIFSLFQEIIEATVRKEIKMSVGNSLRAPIPDIIRSLAHIEIECRIKKGEIAIGLERTE